MKQILSVNTKSEEKDYLIDISDDSFEKLNQQIDEITQGQKRLIIISKKVYDLYYTRLNFKEEEILVLKDGEKEKNYKNYIKILNFAIKLGLTRKDVIIAVGGGVVGDIAGFTASTYMRGIDYIQIPTTLLAMVDSSVGGKTAIDFEEAKNIIGTFYQPTKVIININFLKTLDKRQFLSGMGEIIKYSLIENSCKFDTPLYLFEFLMLGCEKILLREDPIIIMRMIEYCLNLKISVVNNDEKEQGLRKILNLGHTVAHALETITKYKKFTHGEAVVYGMFSILDWAHNHEYISYSYYRLSKELLEKYGFEPLKHRFSKEKLIEIMKKDKKAENGKITFIIPCDKKQVKEIKLTPVEAEEIL